MSIHVIYGDSYLVPETVARLKANSGLSDLLEANHHRLQGNQVRPAELFGICAALPFMDTHRLVEVHRLLTAFERRSGGERRPPARRRRGGDSGNSSSALGGWERLEQMAGELPETTVLVFTDGPVADSNPLLKLLRPIAEVQSLSAPAGEGLARWIKEAAQDRGAAISPSAIKLLVDLVGNDLWTLDRELEKLSLYAFGRAIEEADISLLVSQVREANIFTAVDAMIEGRPGVALRLLRQLRQDGRDASSIIAMVERQLRLLALARDSMDQRLPQREVGKRLGVSSEFVIRKTLEQARRHSSPDIRGRYHRLLEADLAVKQGAMEPDLALELLVAEQARER